MALLILISYLVAVISFALLKLINRNYLPGEKLSTIDKLKAIGLGGLFIASVITIIVTITIEYLNS